MNNLKLIDFNSAILWEKCAAVTDIKKQVKPFYKDMVKIMLTPMNNVRGIGLAAPQVGIALRFFVMILNFPIVCVNPEILEFSSEKESMKEGCLSFPGKSNFIERHLWIKAKWTDENGQLFIQRLEGLTARIFQHEFDHCDGKNIFANFKDFLV